MDCTKCPLMNCPLLKAKQNEPFLDVDIVNSIRKNTTPFCFHCGRPYIKDIPRCTEIQSVWKPDCDCVSRAKIRVVTG